MDSGRLLKPWVSSLGAFWPAMQVLAGEFLNPKTLVVGCWLGGMSEGLMGNASVSEGVAFCKSMKAQLMVHFPCLQYVATYPTPNRSIR